MNKSDSLRCKASTLKDLGEFGLIKKINALFRAPEGFTGIGDDCALLPQKEGFQTLVSTDMLVEGSHFLLGDVSPRDLGWKSAAVNFSDIAACGGRPTGSFLSIALPQKGIGESWIQEFMEGYKEMSDEAGAPLLGGDTTSSPSLMCINVTVLGEAPTGTAKLRCNARPGDLVCVTGTLGDSAAGLKLILEGQPRVPELIRRHYRPQPRLQEGLALAQCPGIHAMMDISDGVASDVRHILKASGVGARIDTAALPLSEEFKCTCRNHGWDPIRLALSGGEDYELLFTMAPGTQPQIPFTAIGQITQETGLIWEGTDGDFLGFRHF